MEEKIKVFIKYNDNYYITAINSEIFIKDLTGWHFFEEGFGNNYAHAQSQYLARPLINDEGQYNYRFINGQIVGA